MRQRDRIHDDDGDPGDGSPGSEGADGLNAMRSAGQRFLDAGEEAISRGLSDFSDNFLRASRQQGGE
jgi:hypothetical protein